MINNVTANRRVIRENMDVANLSTPGNFRRMLQTVIDLMKYNHCSNIEELSILATVNKDFEDAWKEKTWTR